MNSIGLEVSTSSAKCVLYSTREGVVRSESIPFDASTSDTVSQNPGRMVAAAIEALRRVIQPGDREISAIGLGGTWHSLLLLDKQLDPMGPIRTWADVSAAPFVESVRKDPEAVETFYQKTGCMAHAMYPAWKLRHLRRTDPDLLLQTSLVTTQVGHLFTSMTGQRAVSKCMASGSGFFNIHSLDWDPEILELTGLGRDRLEDLVEAFHTAPLSSETARRAGLPSGVPVTVGCADGAMNQLAIGGVEKGVMSFSVGTSGAIRMLRDEPLIPEKPSTWCYYLFDGKRLAGAATQGAANCLSWYLRAVGDAVNPDYAGLERAAGLIDRRHAPYFLPFLFGERCPGWNESRRGGFVGLDSSHQKGHLYHAVLEGILFNLYQCFEILTGVGGLPKEIRVSGGILNSPFWLQMAADIFGAGISTTGFANDSTVGAALTALGAVGAIDRWSDHLPGIVGTYQPRPEFHDLYRARFAKYLEYYATLL